MAVLSIREIYDAAISAGFTQHQAVTWTSIALAESGGKTGALNDRGEYSMGLWQVNVNADSARRHTWGDLNDPENNARAAFAISDQGTDMRPWTTTHDRNQGTNHDYRTYLPEVEKEIGVRGDPRGVSGYGAKKLEPLPGSQDDEGGTAGSLAGPATPDRTTAPDLTPAPAAVGQSAQPVDLDSDGDGLTDAFERLAGTDPHQADTDHDGLSDGHEALKSHTDPLTADTDHDGKTDPEELAAGTDPGRLVGNAGVVGTGIFAENVRGGIKDPDRDGLSTKVEKLIGTSTTTADTDGDHVPDAMEISHGTNPTVADTDYDGFADGIELRYDTNPLGAVGLGAGTATPKWTMEAAAAQRLAERAEPQQSAAAASGAQTSGAAGTQQAGPVSATAGGTGSAAGDGTADSALSTFLRVSRAQLGDTYVFGHEVAMTDKDPDTFDCSELTSWAAHQAGVKIPDGAVWQYLDLKKKGTTISVEEAMRTPGALLFRFSGGEPSGQLRPGQAHVAISDGKGGTIEARGSKYGVVEADANTNRFNFAAVIPGISDQQGLEQRQQSLETAAPKTSLLGADQPEPGTIAAPLTGYDIEPGQPLVQPQALPGAATVDLDSDGDGLTDAFERLAGTDPHQADTDHDGLSDGHEALKSHTDPLTADTDHDGKTDPEELAAGTDPGRLVGNAGVVGTGIFAENVRGGIKDPDRDGLSTKVEKLIGTSTTTADTDGDHVPDAMEISHGTNPTVADTDYDGFADGIELRYDTNPLSADASLAKPDGPAPGAEGSQPLPAPGSGAEAALGHPGLEALGEAPEGLGSGPPSGLGAGLGGDLGSAGPGSGVIGGGGLGSGLGDGQGDLSALGEPAGEGAGVFDNA